MWSWGETLRKCALKIAYDNGMVNRGTAEEEVLASMLGRALGKFTTEQLDTVDKELSALSEEALEDVCCGEQYTSISELADSVLSAVFEE